jgi:butyrate kinase
MDPIQVEADGAIRLTVLTPGDFYDAEVVNADEIRLRRLRIIAPQKKMTREEALQALERSSLRFVRGWDQLKQETRG